jgi:excisionase family DNA binding protein
MTYPTTPRPIALLSAPSERNCHAGGDPARGGGALVGAATGAASAAIARPVLLTAEQVAAMWQVSVSLIYKLRREGKLPFVRIGTLYRFDPEVVRGYVSGGVTPPRRVR